MILADKIINLRKKSGMSQEDLADKLNVSRQAVSKWEGAQSIPDLDKIIALSQLFGVTTDFLLKDEMEIEEPINEIEQSNVNKQKVSMEMANGFINAKNRIAKFVAIGVSLCIISPITLITLGGFSVSYGWDEKLMVCIGLVVMLILVAIAVGLFITVDHKLKDYEFLSTRAFETEYGVVGLVKEKKKEFQDTYFKCNLIGVILCVISVIAIFVGVFSEVEIYAVYGVSIMLAIVAIGIFFIVYGGTKMGALQILLQEGDYTLERKDQTSISNVLSSSYWTLATAIYLLWSFLSSKWNITWIIWVIAGVLFPVVRAVALAIENKKKAK